jgi:hypothetical protein
LFFAALGLFIIKAREYGGARLVRDKHAVHRKRFMSSGSLSLLADWLHPPPASQEVDMDRLFQSVVPAIAIAVSPQRPAAAKPHRCCRAQHRPAAACTHLALGRAGRAV